MNNKQIKESLKTKSFNELMEIKRDLLNEIKSRPMEANIETSEQPNVHGDNITSVANMLNKNALEEKE